MANNNTNYALINFASTYTRTNGQPIDNTAVWHSYSDAANYATTDTAYVGQIISVVDSDAGTCAVYVINQNSELTELGGGNLAAIDALIGSGVVD